MRAESAAQCRTLAALSLSLIHIFSSGMSATSSSSSVPPWARSSTPTLRGAACGSAPASTPNSSTSKRSGARMAQFSATKGPSARRDCVWIMRATVSLPEPGAPVMSTREMCIRDRRSSMSLMISASSSNSSPSPCFGMRRVRSPSAMARVVVEISRIMRRNSERMSTAPSRPSRTIKPSAQSSASRSTLRNCALALTSRPISSCSPPASV